MKFALFASFIALVGTELSCTKDFQAEYSDPVAVEIVDYNWNETDARKTAEILIQSMLKKPWLVEAKKHLARNPIVIIKSIDNRTDEHIDTKSLIEGVRYELINSGAIRFVDGAGRDAVLKEIEYQQDSGHVSAATAKKKGKQIGADYMLSGAISSQVHSNDGLKTVSYITLLQLTDLETAEIVWNEKYDIKKRFKRSGSGW